MIDCVIITGDINSGAGIRLGGVGFRDPPRVAFGREEDVPLQHDCACQHGHPAEEHEFPLPRVPLPVPTQTRVLREESHRAHCSHLRSKVTFLNSFPS